MPDNCRRPEIKGITDTRFEDTLAKYSIVGRDLDIFLMDVSVNRHMLYND